VACPLWLAVCLSFQSGWADVVCMVRYTAFAGMQTGNMVMVGRALVNRPAWDVLFYFSLMGAGLTGWHGRLRVGEAPHSRLA